MTDFIDRLERACSRAEDEFPRLAAPDGTVAVQFTDLRALLAFASRTPTLAPPTVSSWASPSLGHAYKIVEGLREQLAQDPESGIDESLRRALEALESADCELIGIAS